MTFNSTTITALIADVANATDTHQHSVQRALLGLPVRGRSGQRIVAELTRRGVRPLSLATPLASAPNPTEESAAE